MYDFDAVIKTVTIASIEPTRRLRRPESKPNDAIGPGVPMPSEPKTPRVPKAARAPKTARAPHAQAQETHTADPAPAESAAPGAAPPGLDVAMLQARIDALEAQLERGLRFVHVVADRNQRALAGHAALIHGLGDGLTRRGAIDPAEVAATRDAYLQATPAPDVRVRVAPDVDKYTVEPVLLDCADRLPLCKAACCRRPFALSTQDLEEGVLRWNWGDPYVVKLDADGLCGHATDAGSCSVWEQRPLRCRGFDCRQDAGIWIDFDHRVPHPDLAALPTPTKDPLG